MQPPYFSPPPNASSLPTPNTNLLETTILGEIIPQSRPRLGRRGTYTPAPSRDCRRRLAMEFRVRWQHDPIDYPVMVAIVVSLVRPKTPAGTKPFPVHPRAGDVDNLGKQIVDAMQDSGMLSDDRWVTTLLVSKVWGEAAEARVHVSKAGGIYVLNIASSDMAKVNT